MEQRSLGRVRHGPYYFLAILHPPPSPELHTALGEYAFTLNELYKLAPKIRGLPLMVEHAGIVEAVDSTKGPSGQLADRNTVFAKLHDLGESDATHSPVGSIISAEVVQPSGALYAIFQINAGLEWIAWLVRNGFLTGVSLTTLETTAGIRPYEVSLTQEPARPHCYIVFHSTSLDKVRGYMGRVHTGGIRDHSSTLRKPYRIMAASATAMEVEKKEAAAPAKPVVTGEALLAAINAHPEVAQRELLMAGMDMMTKRAAEAEAKTKKEIEDAKAEIAKANAEKEAAEKRGKINAAMMESSLRALRSTVPEGVPFDEDLARCGLTSDKVEDVRAAYGQVLVTASYAGMMRNRKRDATEEATREKYEAEAEDPIHARMAAINNLLGGRTVETTTTATAPLLTASAASAGAGAAAAAPAPAVDAATAAQMKLAAGLATFAPLE